MSKNVINRKGCVRVHHPLKQGLRLTFNQEFPSNFMYECIIH